MKRNAAALAFCFALFSIDAQSSANLGPGLYARFITSKGVILFQLFYEQAPLTVTNFVGLAEGRLSAQHGKKFYDGLVFHRVVTEFVIQGGDPQGDGHGGPGYQFVNEIDPSLNFNAPGMLAMANAGPDTNGSQFFITLTPQPSLNGLYSIFGKVVEGSDIVDQIRFGDKILKVEIVRQGAGASSFVVNQLTFNQREADAKAPRAKRFEEKSKADLALIAAKYSDLVQGADGIWQKTIKQGKGPSPLKGQTVTITYKGMFLDGTVFDDSKQRNAPLSMIAGAGKLIPGWEKILMTMPKGERRLIILPPKEAYGERGVPASPIGPNTYLVFDLEVVNIK